MKTVTHRWFSQQILRWYHQHGRHDLPWKSPCSAYRVWISEIMLQQTQVTTVIPYFLKFMTAFPTLPVLAESALDEVLSHWSGLGYYARARNLHKTAQMLVNEFKGKFPKDIESLIQLPGIGRSTAGAILAQAFGIRAPILDGNVKRVLWRFHCLNADSQKEAEQSLWEWAQAYTPHTDVADYTQAMMDLGATLCTRSQPRCEHCPLQSRCQAFAQNKQTDFPPTQNKKKLPTRHVHMLCLMNAKGEILLQKRPLTGIWGGLWSFPEFEDEAAAQQFLKQQVKQRYTVDPLPALKHTFTHFHLWIQSSLVKLNKMTSLIQKDLCWTSLNQLSERGLPTPIKKLLKQMRLGVL